MTQTATFAQLLANDEECILLPALSLGMNPMHSAAANLSRHGERPEPVEIWKARKFISENLEEKISLRDVASAVSICPSYLSERFKEVTGEHFVGYVARVRVEKACELLRSSRLRISDIAFASGFQSLSQFNRVFRKLRGKSPRSYRAELARTMNEWNTPRASV
jgi:AraC-like DNA-binding protein